MSRNQKLIEKFLVKEFKKFPHADLLEEGILDRMGARVAGAFSKGLSGDESRSIAKKVQRIINTHRVEMESDFAKLDITDTPAVEQVLDAMRKMENAAKQYLGGEKARSGGYVTKQGDAAPPIDTDNDGKPDAQDTDGDGKPEVFDTDGDGQIDAQDTNNDGKPDAGGSTVNVFKGKGGKGLQSTLDKLKLDPAVRNAVLKSVAAQLKSQGVNVLEEEDFEEMANARQARRPRQPRRQNRAPGIEDMLGGPESVEADKQAAAIGDKAKNVTPTMPVGSKPPVRKPNQAKSGGPTITLSGKDGIQSALNKAGIKGTQQSQIVKAIQAWAKSSNLEINESQLLKDLSEELLVESRFDRWRKIAGLLRS
tara:strand:+ start:413 stop:1510 length:1098 start_codon:yes stop_codon:yes gene_type:complete